MRGFNIMEHQISPFRRLLIYLVYLYISYALISLLLQKYEIKYNTRLDDCGIITKKYQTYVKARGGYYIEWIEVKAGKGHFKFLISEENYDKNPTFQENNHICFKYVRLKFELIFFHNKKNSDFSLLKHGKRNSLTIAVFYFKFNHVFTF